MGEHSPTADLPPSFSSLMAQQVKKLPTMQESQEMQAQSLGQEDPLGKQMVIHSSILA